MPKYNINNSLVAQVQITKHFNIHFATDPIIVIQKALFVLL